MWPVLRVALRVPGSGLQPGSLHPHCYARQHHPHGPTQQDAVIGVWTAAIALGLSEQPKLPAGAGITPSQGLPSRSRLQPCCRHRAHRGLGLNRRVCLMTHPKAGVARLCLACRPHRQLAQVLLRIPLWLATRCERKKLVLASVVASSPRSASCSRFRLAACISQSALLRAAALPARPNTTRRSHKGLDGSTRAGCMSAAQGNARRSHHDIHGATKPVKIAARLPEPFPDGH